MIPRLAPASSREGVHEAPVWIVPCLKGGTSTPESDSILPAIQNMLPLYLRFEKEAEAALGLPDGVHFLCDHSNRLSDGPVRRVALVDLVFEDRWGQAYRDL
jgi:hypothetical protein